MREHPILFSTPMVKAILELRKTQTRRVMKPQPEWLGQIRDVSLGEGWYWKTKIKDAQFNNWHNANEFADVIAKSDLCPYGQIGDRFWVRETHYRYGHWNKYGLSKNGKQKWLFKADTQEVRYYDNKPDKVLRLRDKDKVGWFKRSSLFMPRWASRITLEITEIRVQRLQDISNNDAWAEGVSGELKETIKGYVETVDYIGPYHRLWNKINGNKNNWSSNPFVWVIKFKLSTITKEVNK